MSNKFHRKLSDGELHRPERTGEGDPNDQSLFQVEDGQYYQDTLTGDIWRYVLSSDAWELLLDYDRQNNLITNAQQRYDIKTQQIGELRSNIDAGSTVTSVDAYLFTQVRQGEDITVYQSGNTDNAISFTVTTDNEGGETTIAVESETAAYDFLVGDPIKLDAGLLSAYQSADPTKIYSSISEERSRISIGSLQNLIAKNASVSSIVLTRETTQTLSLRDSQFLYIYTKDGVGQFIQVDGDQTLNGSPITIAVYTFTASYAYDEDSYVVEPAWASTTQITQTANTVTILSQTVSETSNAVASINTRTGILESDVTALALVNDGQNTSISTAQLTATNAYAEANTSVKFNNVGAYIQLIAGAGGSEITLQSNQININGLITAINDTGGLDGSATIESNTEPTQRESSANLEIGDIWIDTDAGNKPYVWRNTGSIEEWVAAYTQINGGDITTGTINASVVTVANINASLINTGTIDVANLISANAITAEEINVANLLAQTLNVGNVIQSTNFDSNNGFAVYSNGKAYFRDVIIAGTSVTVNGNVTTGTGSNIDGTYVSNINAGNIVVGTLDANVVTVANLNASEITAGTISVERINVDAILAESATINNTLTIGTLGAVSLGSATPRIELSDSGLDFIGIIGNYAITAQYDSDQSRDYLEIENYVDFRDSINVASDARVHGNVQASYKSDDGTEGISGNFQWNDANALQDHNVVVKNGIITQWTVT